MTQKIGHHGYLMFCYHIDHSSTGFTPFELVFGRKINKFENWQCRNLDQEDLELFNRSVELRKLVEQDYTRVKEKCTEVQIRQKLQQDRQHKVKIDKLESGSVVYIRDKRAKVKLQARYHGPYTIDSQTPNGNYWLINSKGVRLKQSIPLSRL